MLKRRPLSERLAGVVAATSSGPGHQAASWRKDIANAEPSNNDLSPDAPMEDLEGDEPATTSDRSSICSLLSQDICASSDAHDWFGHKKPANEAVCENCGKFVEQLQAQVLQLQKSLYFAQQKIKRSQAAHSTFDETVNDMQTLRTNINHLTNRLKEEEERNQEIESAKRLIDNEYESLSVQLFEQANTLVRDERIIRAHAERKLRKTEQLLLDSKQLTENLQSELSALKKLMQDEQDLASSSCLHDSTGANTKTLGSPEFFTSPNLLPSRLLSNKSGEEWRADAFPMSLTSPARTLSHPVSPSSAIFSPHSNLPPSPMTPSLQPVSVVATTLLPKNLKSEFESFLRILLARIGPPESHCLYINSEHRDNSLYRTKFMERLFAEDIKPTLNFTALSWLQKKGLAGAVSVGQITIVPRREPIMINRKETLNQAALSKAKPFLNVIQNNFKEPARREGPATEEDKAGQNCKDNNADDDQATSSDYNNAECPPQVNCWGCGTEVANEPPSLTVVHLKDQDAPRPICGVCRGKLAAVCHLFSYLRMVSSGIVPSEAQKASRSSVKEAEMDSPASTCSTPPVSTVVRNSVASGSKAFLQRTASFLSLKLRSSNETTQSSPASDSAGVGRAENVENEGAEVDEHTAPSSLPTSTKTPKLGFLSSRAALFSRPMSFSATSEAPSAGDHELILPLTPILVSVLWSDLCLLRQRMFLARMAAVTTFADDSLGTDAAKSTNSTLSDAECTYSTGENVGKLATKQLALDAGMLFDDYEESAIQYSSATTCASTPEILVTQPPDFESSKKLGQVSNLGFRARAGLEEQYSWE